MKPLNDIDKLFYDTQFRDFKADVVLPRES